MIELATKLVVLLTAVVGLLAVARSTIRPAAAQSVGPSEFGQFVKIVSVLATILAFPLFLMAFIWIITSIGGVAERATGSSAPSSRRSPAADSLARALGLQSEPAYAMFSAASEITQTARHDAALVRTASFALQNNKPDIAWLAARAITRTSTHDSVLVATVAGYLALRQYAKAAVVLPDITATGTHDSTGEAVANAVSRQPRPDSSPPKP